MGNEIRSNQESWSRFAQVFSVVVGVVISVWNITAAYQKDADARRIEAAKPFLELRQKRYTEAIQAASILASQKFHTPDEIDAARKRFWELYWGELSLVEEADVETAMVKLGASLEPGLKKTPQQDLTYCLAHALRDSLIRSWGVGEKYTGSINPACTD